ncbi:MAG: YggT family protein [Clostridia bacterium]|nr:YggT family protein [Clostridia bacterium]
MTAVLTTAGQILAKTVLYLLFALELAMLVRSVMSWFLADEENRFGHFLVVITEPVIVPVRLLFNKFNWFQDTPLDVPFLVTFVLLILLQSSLQLAV